MLNPDIIRAVAVTAELTGAQLSEPAMEAMVEHLSGYPTDQVLAALHRCQVELRGALTLAAVMDRLDDGHPGPEIAWAMVARLDEEASIVWTDEIAEAFGVVRGMLNDRVGARLAFLEAYRLRLAEARVLRRPPHWWPSLGYDQAGRVAAIREAVDKKRLPASTLRRLLPHEEPVDMAALGEGGQEQAKALVQTLTRRRAADLREQSGEQGEQPT